MAVFLGLDCSTQSLTGLAIDTERGEIIARGNVNFEKDLPEYASPNGVLPCDDPRRKRSNPLMWCAALDALFAELSGNGLDLGRIAGISGSGQQHGSVYLNADFTRTISSLPSSSSLAEIFEPSLSRKTSPIWMDSSTSVETAEIAAAVGERLRLDSGSAAIERFTGPQIRKFWKDDPSAYAETARVHLVSSFLSSILAGKDSPIDFGDGAGMNLLNLKTLQWDSEFAAATAPGIIGKLPPPAPSTTKLGTVSPYFAEKYGVADDAVCLVWSGDNPNSLVGVGASAPGTAVLSLGTSDTFFASMDCPATDPDGCGHIFGNPGGGFMALICFVNGSLAREKIRDKHGLDWKGFDKAVLDAPPGNDGNMMLPYFEPEATPPIGKPGVRLHGSDDFISGRADAPRECRAIVESQLVSVANHSKWISSRLPFSKIRITGGASESSAIRSIAADVFQVDVEVISATDSAALGAAMRAANAVEGVAFEELAAVFAGTVETIEPNGNNAGIYDRMGREFADLERGNADS